MDNSKPKPNDKPKDGFVYSWNNRILVVDDEREIAASYKHILAPPSKVAPVRSSRGGNAQLAAVKPNFDFDVVAAHSAEEALTEVRKAVHAGKPFAVGFFDVMLTGSSMDGFQLVKEIHKLQPDIYAVFVTAYNDRSVDSIHTFLGEDKADHWDYLNKPFTDGEILQKARNFITLYNLQKEKEVRDRQLAELHRTLVESERKASVAAVARGVGHEFGNLLMQIMGTADVNLGKGEADLRKAMERILDASSRASEILDRFKNLSAPAGSVRDREVSYVDEIMAEALDLMDHQFQRTTTKICRIKMDRVKVPMRSTALIQVFVNLLINSIHAMGNGGQIDLSIQDLGDTAEIRVRDYGPGADPQVLPQLATPFFTTKGDKGTGLGLSICREIIEIDHGGEFRVHNHNVKGFEVVMRIPVRDVQGEAA